MELWRLLRCQIFRHGRRYLVGIASLVSDYLRALPHWLAEKSPALGLILFLVFKQRNFRMAGRPWGSFGSFFQQPRDRSPTIHLRS